MYKYIPINSIVVVAEFQIEMFGFPIRETVTTAGELHSLASYTKRDIDR